MKHTQEKKALLDKAIEIGLGERYLKEFKHADEDFKEKCPDLIKYFEYKQPKEYLKTLKKFSPKTYNKN